MTAVTSRSLLRKVTLSRLRRVLVWSALGVLLVVPSVQGTTVQGCEVNQYDTGTDASSSEGSVYHTYSGFSYLISHPVFFTRGSNAGNGFIIPVSQQAKIQMVDTSGSLTDWVGSGTTGSDTSGTGTSINIPNVRYVCLNPDETIAYALTASPGICYIYEIIVATASVTRKRSCISGNYPYADKCAVTDTHFYAIVKNGIPSTYYVKRFALPSLGSEQTIQSTSNNIVALDVNKNFNKLIWGHSGVPTNSQVTIYESTISSTSYSTPAVKLTTSFWISGAKTDFTLLPTNPNAPKLPTIALR